LEFQLPVGWSKEIKSRTTSPKIDTFFINPNGDRYRSLVEAQRALAVSSSSSLPVAQPSSLPQDSDQSQPSATTITESYVEKEFKMFRQILFNAPSKRVKLKQGVHESYVSIDDVNALLDELDANNYVTLDIDGQYVVTSIPLHYINNPLTNKLVSKYSLPAYVHKIIHCKKNEVLKLNGSDLSVQKGFNIYVNIRQKASSKASLQSNENIIGSLFGWGSLHGTIVIELARGWRQKSTK
jgi:hypothetical protein